MVLSQKETDFTKNSFYCGDTHSLYIEKKYWKSLDKACLVGCHYCRGKND